MKPWIYAHAPESKVGLMICRSCLKPIVEGDFRYYETEEEYRCQHRACSPGDGWWEHHDRRQEMTPKVSATSLAAAREAWHYCLTEERYVLPSEIHAVGAIIDRHFTPLRHALIELRATVKAECPQLLNEDSGGSALLDEQIDTALSQAATVLDLQKPIQAINPNSEQGR